jgi:hypothetical protein
MTTPGITAERVKSADERGTSVARLVSGRKSASTSPESAKPAQTSHTASNEYARRTTSPITGPSPMPTHAAME